MLEQYRTQLDELDRQIIELLDKRFDVTRQIGEYKQANNVQVFDENREQLIINKIKDYDLVYEQQVIDVYQNLMEVSKRQQHE